LLCLSFPLKWKEEKLATLSDKHREIGTRKVLEIERNVGRLIFISLPDEWNHENWNGKQKESCEGKSMNFLTD